MTPWRVWFIATLFFAFQFVLRLFPGLVMDETMILYGIDAEQFGQYAGMYYIGYAGMQIPAAWLMVRYPIGRVLGAAAMLCGLGAWLSGIGSNIYLLYVSRVLIGAGSAFAFLGVSEVLTQWFPKERYARMVGVTFTLGLLGAVYGGRPVAALIASSDWHLVLNMLAFIHVVIGAMIWFFVYSPNGSSIGSFQNYAAGLVTLARNKSLMILAVANMLMVGALEGFADIWGTSFFTKALSIDKPTASGLTSLIFVGMIFGGPILAQIARFLRSELTVLIGSGLILAMIFVVLLFNAGHASLSVLEGGMLFVGMLCCYQVLVFALGIQLASSPALLGLTTAFLNCINMCGGVIFHNIIGAMVASHANGAMPDLSDYVYGLTSIPLGALFGALLLIYLHIRKKGRI